MAKYKALKNFMRISILTFLALYIGVIGLLRIPYIQRQVSGIVADELSRRLKTTVGIEQVDLGLLNRVIIRNLSIKDRTGKKLLQASRLSAKVDLSALFNGKIRINSTQLFGLQAYLRHPDANSPGNYEFLLDAFASDNKGTSSPLDLKINTVLIRRGQIRYDVENMPETAERLNLHHLAVKNLSATLSLKTLTADSLHLHVRRMSFQEKSGLQLRKLSFKLSANKKQFRLDKFEMALPHSEVFIPELTADYTLPLKKENLLRHMSIESRVVSHLDFRDLAFLAPQLKQMDIPLDVSFEFVGKRGKLLSEDIRIENPDEGISMRAEAMIDGNIERGPYIFGKIEELQLSQKAVNNLYRTWVNRTDSTSPLTRVEHVRFSGDISGYLHRMTTQGHLQTGFGNLEANVTLHTDTVTHGHTFSGVLHSESIHLGKLLGQEKWGETAFNIEVKDLKLNSKLTESYIKGTVSKLEYNKYTYENISLDGTYRQGGFDGQLALEDPNGIIRIDGRFNTQGKQPYYNLHASVKNFNPHRLQLTREYEGTDISGSLTADFSGKNIDDLVGEIRIDSLYLLNADPEKNFALREFSVTATQREDKQKEIRVTSSFLNGTITGYYSYQSLLNSMKSTAQQYLPTLFAEKRQKDTGLCNNFSFALTVTNAEIFRKIFHFPLELGAPARLNGFFDDNDKKLYLKGDAAKFKYKGSKYEDGMLLCENKSGHIAVDISTKALLKEDNYFLLSLHGKAQNDSLFTALKWSNKASSYSGKVEATATFDRAEKAQELLTNIAFHPGNIVLNDTLWSIHPSHVRLSPDRYEISNFLIDHGEQYLRINGKIGKQSDDLCEIDLKKLNVSYIIDMLKFDAVEFAGMASGNVRLQRALATPILDAALFVKDFRFNKGYMGDAQITAEWDEEVKGIRLNALMYEKEKLLTTVTGFVSPAMDGLDLHIGADGTELAFMESFVGNIFSGIKGRGYGQVRLFGPFSHLDLEGRLKADANVLVNVLKTRFDAHGEEIVFTPGRMEFNKITLSDGKNHTGTAQGVLLHTKLRNMSYDFKFASNGMLVYNTKEATVDFPFYGKIFATGNMRLRGEGNRMSIDGSIRSERNTEFTYVLGGITQAISNKFITFVDKTPQPLDTLPRHDYDSSALYPGKKENTSSTDIHINMQVEATPEAHVKIIMDPITGDNISSTGSGTLRINYFNKGAMQMYGTYQIAGGLYKMSMQNVIRKDFSLRPGGVVSFNGDPMAANLNLQAVYTVSSASLNDLVAATTTSRTVRVNCIANLTGKMTDPEIKFDLELPGVNEEDKELVRSLTATQEQMNTQIIYLLGIGKFYSANATEGYTQSNATSSLAFNTLSGQLNNLLSNAINNQNWNFGANISTGQNGWTDVEAEAVLSGRLLNNRLLLNGNFGYRENTLRNTNFVGDFEAVWLLTRNGDFRVKGYNKTNDRYFTKSTLTTQGIGFMYQKDFTSWKNLFNWFSRKKKENRKPSTSDNKQK